MAPGALLAVWLLLPAAAQEEAPAAEPEAAEEGEELDARLTEFTGTVYVHPQGLAEDRYVPAASGAPLEAGDHVRTGTDGWAEVGLDGGSVIHLNANTDFIVNSLDPAETEFFLGIGSLVAKLRSLALGRQMQFRTSTAVAAVRGTELAIEQASDEEPARIGVFDEGRVAVRSHDDQSEVTLGPGQEIEVRRGEAPSGARRLDTLVRHRRSLVTARRRLEGLRQAWQPMARTQRRELHQKFIQQRAVRTEQMRNVRQEMRQRHYQDMRQRQQDLRRTFQERRHERHQDRQERRHDGPGGPGGPGGRGPGGPGGSGGQRPPTDFQRQQQSPQHRQQMQEQRQQQFQQHRQQNQEQRQQHHQQFQQHRQQNQEQRQQRHQQFQQRPRPMGQPQQTLQNRPQDQQRRQRPSPGQPPRRTQ